MILFRYLLTFLMPIMAAIAFFYATTPLRIEALRESAEFLDAASTLDAEELLHFLLEQEDANWISAIDLLRSLAIGTILLTCAITSLTIRAEDSDQRRLNLLTALVAGFALAHLVIRFGFLRWWELGLSVGAGVVVAIAILWLRDSFSMNDR